MARLPPIIAFAAPSGTGKTTLIERVVRVLVDRGVRVGVLKADAHRVVLDKPGKDSWRFAEAGAAMVAVLSVERLALFERLDGEVTLLSAVERLFPGVDIVLVEGFRRSGVPTVQVHRAGGPSTVGWDPPVNRVAWASDCEGSTLTVGDGGGALPVFSLSDPSEIADWLMQRFLSRAPSRAPTIVCPVADPGRLEVAVAAATRLAREVGGRAMVVASPDIPVRRVAAGEGPDCDVVTDIRPGMGLLGALYTGLAAARTPEILFVGPRYWDATASSFAGILRPGLSDVVYTVADGFPEPALALYGHRCLSAIQAALLSGEFKLTGWWGQVRTLAG